MMADHDSLQGSPVTRRRFGVVAGGAIVSFALGGACQGSELRQRDGGRIAARPGGVVRTSAAGTRPLRLGGRRDAVLHLPARRSGARVPLLVLLHGAGGSGDSILRRFAALADDAGVAVLAPDSRDSTWDVIGGGYGPDVEFLNRALERVFDSVSADPSRVAVGGFSDGASYALSIGLVNGDLFRRILAFSPGFVAGGQPQGKPRIFVSHGTTDRILPIDRCSRMIVPGLQKHGYEVTYREFVGGHTVPADVAREGMRWVAAESNR
jgi:phospholipase/carboxylesterase